MKTLRTISYILIVSLLSSGIFSIWQDKTSSASSIAASDISQSKHPGVTAQR